MAPKRLTGDSDFLGAISGCATFLQTRFYGSLSAVARRAASPAGEDLRRPLRPAPRKSERRERIGRRVPFLGSSFSTSAAKPILRTAIFLFLTFGAMNLSYYV
jgi:hypothetical protein